MGKEIELTAPTDSKELTVGINNWLHQVGFVFFDNNDNPITSGLTGTITIQAAAAKDAAFVDVPEGSSIDVSASLEPVQVEGFVETFKFDINSISGNSVSTVKFVVNSMGG